MRVALHGKNFSEQSSPVMKSIFDLVIRYSSKIFLTDRYAKVLSYRQIQLPASGTFSRGHLPEVDVVITLGGDGTLLDTLTYIGNRETPILGINTGRLGFLATIPIQKFAETFRRVQEGEYKIDRRSLISLQTKEGFFNRQNFALNEFTVTKKDSSSMITVRAFIDNEYVNSYWADGLIVSTPTGSTGYSMSCGGPLMHPGTGNFIITPVSPHHLNVRPMIVPDSSIVKLEIESRSRNVLISLDSRSQSIPYQTEIILQKEKFDAHLIHMPDYSFYDTLRHKLNWGMDLRN
ncbi:NAD kinase [Persicobacter psychrovividus]|uniref:NAD kinase n=1 Tax=Persicobacter psychrovividus TaxID=387638 RepID=A0ABN6L4M2_9BACT|nr:NAD kinase [Persicobacter psychrovividus]